VFSGSNHGVLHCYLESVMQGATFFVIACAVDECLLRGDTRILPIPSECYGLSGVSMTGVLGFVTLIICSLDASSRKKELGQNINNTLFHLNFFTLSLTVRDCSFLLHL
jgi:hypothetical protein